MRTYFKVLPVLAGWLLFAAAAAQAAPDLSLEEAVAIAAQNQPLLQSLEDAAAATREAAVAAGQLPDPRLKLGIQNMPITGGDTGRFNRDDMTMSTVGVMQEVVPRAKREAASRSEEAVAQQFQTEKAVTARAIQRSTALAWVDAYEAQRRTELYQDAVDEMKAERKVLLGRLSSSASQSADVLKLDTELAMMNDKRLTAMGDERRARANLARWIGAAAQRTMAPELRIAPLKVDREQAMADLDQHPLLQNARQVEAMAASEADRARAERALNWSWELMYGKRRSDLSDMVTFQVAMDLPWDRANRQDKRTAEKMVLVDKARKLTEDRRRELQAELDSTLADAEIAEAREQEHMDRLIPAAQARVKLAQAAYQAGKDNLSELWEARRALISVEIEHWAILADRKRAALKLDALRSLGSLAQGGAP